MQNACIITRDSGRFGLIALTAALGLVPSSAPGMSPFDAVEHARGASADYDGDGDIDIDDYRQLHDCFSGSMAMPEPNEASIQACLTAFDADGDSDVDFFDAAGFFTDFTGPPPPSMQYEVVFDSTWNAETHPWPGFPSIPHFSRLVGGTHNDSVTFWELGGIATDGIEAMAELGLAMGVKDEVEAAIALGDAGEVILGSVINPSPGQTTTSFTATQTFPLATVVSMIAPSPDWFVGVSSVPLFENNQWVEELVIVLPPLDAGTDSGVFYTSPDADTQPREPISELTGPPFATEPPVDPLGTFTFRRVE